MVYTSYPTGVEQLFGTEFFSYVLPWLFIFAVVYGILSHVGEKGVPQSKPARGIIGIVLAFIITPSLSGWVPVLMDMTGSFIIVISAFLVLIILLETLGIKKKYIQVVGKDEKGNPKTKIVEKSIFEAYGKWFALLFIIIAILIFIGSGAPQALGWNIPSIISYNYPLIFFLIVISLIIWWMSSEE
ncbi:MAG: hypothetical protein J7L45_00455 [Candidatus Aenigmarchaeota archaeon]|nr:hypothetical protein [Candidatus Aenigmarchaeota archaeon]